MHGTSTSEVKRDPWMNCWDEVLHLPDILLDGTGPSRRVQIRAKRAYQLFKRNPAQPGLNFKQQDPKSTSTQPESVSDTVHPPSLKATISSGSGLDHAAYDRLPRVR